MRSRDTGEIAYHHGYASLARKILRHTRDTALATGAAAAAARKLHLQNLELVAFWFGSLTAVKLGIFALKVYKIHKKKIVFKKMKVRTGEERKVIPFHQPNP